MAVYAVIDSAGTITNRIVLDDPAQWSPPEGCSVALEPSSGYDIGGTLISGVYTSPAPIIEQTVPPPSSVLPQDLMAQFTSDDLTHIKAAVDANIQFWGLWQAMTAQKDPMVVTNARFLQGWGALTQVLGADRMNAIAVSLGVTVG